MFFQASQASFFLAPKPSCATLFVLTGSKSPFLSLYFCLLFFRRDQRPVRQEYDVPVLAFMTSGSWLTFQKINKIKLPLSSYACQLLYSAAPFLPDGLRLFHCYRANSLAASPDPDSHVESIIHTSNQNWNTTFRY